MRSTSPLTWSQSEVVIGRYVQENELAKESSDSKCKTGITAGSRSNMLSETPRPGVDEGGPWQLVWDAGSREFHFRNRLITAEKQTSPLLKTGNKLKFPSTPNSRDLPTQDQIHSALDTAVTTGHSHASFQFLQSHHLPPFLLTRISFSPPPARGSAPTTAYHGLLDDRILELILSIPCGRAVLCCRRRNCRSGREWINNNEMLRGLVRFLERGGGLGQGPGGMSCARA
ncbi:hypothetical protein VTI74DRAFT_7472 [Chaetomium olivicolor]